MIHLNDFIPSCKKLISQIGDDSSGAIEGENEFVQDMVLSSIGMPPAFHMSFATYNPPGFKFAR